MINITQFYKRLKIQVSFFGNPDRIENF